MYKLTAANAMAAQGFRQVLSPGPGLVEVIMVFCRDCDRAISSCIETKLLKTAVELMLCWAVFARHFEMLCEKIQEPRGAVSKIMKVAERHMEHAKQFCENPFQRKKELVSSNLDLKLHPFLYASIQDQTDLRTSSLVMKLQEDAVDKVLKSLAVPFGQDWQDEDAVKESLMGWVGGGIVAENSAWFICENGHPFAMFEWIKPGGETRCPECGSSPTRGWFWHKIAL